ncbi:MAG: flippase-like domain-containing protein [Thermocrinis sp.]|nr:flippase-like domain-containing protein [Thermocrinis sp.]
MLRPLLYGIALTVLVLTGSFLYVLKRTMTKEIFELLLLLDKRYLFLSILSMFFYHTFDNIRLFILARAMNLRYSFFYGYLISFINTFGATITPAHVGGEMMSLYTLSRKGGRLHKVMSVVVMKTLTGMVFFVFLSPLLVYYFYKHTQEAVKLFVILVVLGLLSLLVYRIFKHLFDRSKDQNQSLMLKIKYTLKRFIIVSKLFLRDKKKHIFLAILSSMLLYVCFLLSGAFLLSAFEPSVSFSKAIFSQIALLYAIFLSPTPGGSGVGEVGGLEVFSGFLPAYMLGSFVILWRFITQYLSAIIGGVLFFSLLFKDARAVLK